MPRRLEIPGLKTPPTGKSTRRTEQPELEEIERAGEEVISLPGNGAKKPNQKRIQ